MTQPITAYACNGVAVRDAEIPLNLYGSAKNVRLHLADVSSSLSQSVPPECVDLLEIATLVYAGDQRRKRGQHDAETAGEHWRRSFRFRIPVRMPQLWRSPAVQESLVSLLSFLSEDEYEFEFVEQTHPVGADEYFSFATPPSAERPRSVILFSGGLDSLGGVVEQVVCKGEPAILVSHESSSKLKPRTDTLRRMIEQRTTGPIPWSVVVRANMIELKEREYTQRSRSFLYASIAAVVARMLGLSSIRFFENGIVSLNLPLSPQVVGSRATRTTHPKALAAMATLFGHIFGSGFGVTNGFQWKTKAEVVKGILDAKQGDMIGWSTSCMHTWTFSNEHPHCGACSQCIDRRFAVLAAGAEAYEAASTYRHDLMTSERSEDESRVLLASYVETAQQVSAMSEAQFFSRFGVAARVLRHVGLSADEAAKMVFDLYLRHSKEVMRVLDEGIARNASGIRLRTLPRSCLVRLAHDSSLVPDDVQVINAAVAPVPANASAPEAPNALLKTGKYWTIRFNGIDNSVLDQIGVYYLHELIGFPHKTFTVSQLALLANPDAREGGSMGGEAEIDRTAAATYWRRLNELDGEISDAEREGDVTQCELLKREREVLLNAVKNSGFAKRVKLESKDARRLRQKVSVALRRAVAAIRAESDAAGAHFEKSITYGSVISYRPSGAVEWER